MTTTAHLSPTQANERSLILDTLRGFAILGIALANYPELSLYTFLPTERAAELPASGCDRALRFLLYTFVDGKFYTIFSLLFGVGFSIILQNITRKGGRAIPLFLRRMSLLALLGILHLMLLWSGDILLLYALLGMLLPLFHRFSDRTLLTTAGALLLLPVAADALCELTQLHPAAPLVHLQQQLCTHYGITDFATWLHSADTYNHILTFLLQGAIVRAQEFIDGHRALKVLGLFLIGYCIGRHHLYARLAEHRHTLKRIALISGAAGLLFSPLFAWSSMHNHPWGLTLHSLLYTLSVYPLAFAYTAGICLSYLRWGPSAPLRWLAAPGRMALTNYISQSLAGVLLFYGIGCGLGASLPLWAVELIALLIFITQLLLSLAWLHLFRYGPLEWVWRLLTYGRWFPCLR